MHLEVRLRHLQERLTPLYNDDEDEYYNAPFRSDRAAWRVGPVEHRSAGITKRSRLLSCVGES